MEYFWVQSSEKIVDASTPFTNIIALQMEI